MPNENHPAFHELSPENHPPTAELVRRCRDMAAQILTDGPGKRLFNEIADRLEKQHRALALAQPFLKDVYDWCTTDCPSDIDGDEAKRHLDQVTDLLRIN